MATWSSGLRRACLLALELWKGRFEVCDIQESSVWISSTKDIFWIDVMHDMRTALAEVVRKGATHDPSVKLRLDEQELCPGWLLLCLYHMFHDPSSHQPWQYSSNEGEEDKSSGSPSGSWLGRGEVSMQKTHPDGPCEDCGRLPSIRSRIWVPLVRQHS